MEYLASSHPPARRRGSELTVPFRQGRKCGARFIVAAGLVSLLVIAACATNLFAQSGRRNAATAGPSPTPTGQRPRRVAGPDGQAAPASTPATRTNGASDEPPPFPSPSPKRVANVPVRQATDEGDNDEVVRISSNLVTVPASVVDELGRPVTTLNLQDFELRVDGQPKPISDLTRSDSPVRLVMLFDNSDSLTLVREFEKQAAVRFFRNVMRPTDQAAIYSVTTETDNSLEQPFTSDVQKLGRTIERFGKPEGATPLFDAMVKAVDYMRSQTGRKVMVIVSDGVDTVSQIDFEGTLRRMLASDIQIYVVQTGLIENANLRDLVAERRMEVLTAQTGGAVYQPKANPDLDFAFAQISADLAQQYVLSYYPQDERNDGRLRVIGLRVAGRPNLRVRSRRGYYPHRYNERITGLGPPSASENAATVAAVTSTPTMDPARQDGATTVALPAASAVLQPASIDDAPRSTRVGPTETTDPPVIDRPVTANESPRASAPPATQPAATPTATPVATPTPAPTPRPSPESTPQPKMKPPAQPSEATAGRSTAPTGAAPASPKKPVSGGILNSRALNLPKPEYPTTARTAEITGTVTVEVMVDETGKVIAAHAVAGPAILRQSSVSAAYHARFSPTLLSGEPVPVIGIIKYIFSLGP